MNQSMNQSYRDAGHGSSRMGDGMGTIQTNPNKSMGQAGPPPNLGSGMRPGGPPIGAQGLNPPVAMRH
jgi:hypothetical protein